MKRVTKKKGTQLTNEKKQPVGGSFSVRTTLHTIQAHSRDNWADKVNVEDAEDVGQMKGDGNGQEAKTRKARHLLFKDGA